MHKRKMRRLKCLVFIGLTGIILAACSSSSDTLTPNLTIQGTVEYLDTQEAASGVKNSEAQRYASGIQVCTLGHCAVTDQNGAFSFNMNSAETADGKVLFQFSGPGWTRDLLVENIPGGSGSITFRFSLHDNTVFGGVSGSDTTCSGDNLCARGCKVCSYTLMIDMVVEKYWETGDSGCGNCNSYIKSKTWKDSQGVVHDQVEQWEYVNRSDTLTVPVDQIDPAALPGSDRGVQYIAFRAANDRTANYVYVNPGSSGGMIGHALYLSVKGTLVYAKFLPFEEAIRKGNNHIESGAQQSGDSNPSDAQLQSSDADNDTRSIASYEKGNIKTEVSTSGAGIHYFVNVYADKKSVITIYKDCNLCTLFNFTTADARAKSYLNMLQGWKHN